MLITSLILANFQTFDINKKLIRGGMFMKVENLKVYNKALIVVDMVNGFVKEGVLHDKSITRVIPRQIELIKEYHNEGQLVIFIQDTHTKDSTEHNRFPDFHCLKNSGEEEVVEELKPFTDLDNTFCILKNSTSFMESPYFREMIGNATNIKEFDIVGCCTDICVCNGSIGLANYLDEHNRDNIIRVHKDAIATFLEDTRQNYIDAAYLLMEQQGIQLVKKI